VPHVDAKSRLSPLLLLGAIGLVSLLVVGPKVPNDQTVHVILGASADRVHELQIRYFGPLSEKEAAGDVEDVTSSGNFAREATFRYGQDVHAPRIVDHTPRLVNGDYVVEITLATSLRVARTARHVHLQGEHSVSIDVAEMAKVKPNGETDAP